MSDHTQLYLVRHAIAAEAGPAFPDDSRRPLTGRGAARLRKSVRGLVGLDVGFDQIFTSPFVRARQTAELIAEGLPGRPSIVNLAALAPGGTPADVLAALATDVRRSRVAIVGHEPLMGELAARLIGARAPLPFKKGAVCRIDVAALPLTRPGCLRWFLTPGQLRRIGR